MNPLRLILHAGFHKTGTSTIQATLRKNRRSLAAEFRVFLRDDILPMTETARGFSIAQDPAELGLFSYEIAEFFQSLDQSASRPSDPRPIVISAEDLCGHMPGRHGITRYEAAPKLMATFAEIAALALQQTVEISFLFTTRAPAAWVRSCHAQHLRAIRMTDDLATYEHAFLPHADLDSIAAQIRTAVAPHTVVTAALEDAATRRLGPASALFDLMQPSASLRRSLTAMPAQNTALPIDINEQLQNLNQSALDDMALKMAKHALLSHARNPEQ